MLRLEEFVQLMQRDGRLVLVQVRDSGNNNVVVLGETDGTPVDPQSFRQASEWGLLKLYGGPRWRLSAAGKRWRPGNIESSTQ